MMKFRKFCLIFAYLIALVFPMTSRAETRAKRIELEQDYKRSLEQQIFLRVRREAARIKFPGRVVLKITVDRSGNVVQSELQESSGAPYLDGTVLHAIPVGTHLPPFPSGVTVSFLDLTVPINFRSH